MSNAPRIHIPWQECAFLASDQVAFLFGRSPDWVRARITAGDLEGVRLLDNGPIVVRVPSILALMARVDPQEDRASTTSAVRPAPRAYPRLAWTNPHPIN